MSPPPAHPKIYHITHVDNLASIIADGALCSDALRIAETKNQTNIGMTAIKQRRLGLPVRCHPETMVGDFVPFYFCPRSVMLYILHRGNHPGITYTAGQRPIVHLQADLLAVVSWAEVNGQRWAFSTSNAGAAYAEFSNTLGRLDRIDWKAVHATDFRDPPIKEGKQAEFLLHERLPWCLVEHVGVIDAAAKAQVTEVLANAAHVPPVTVKTNWYY